MSRLYGVVGFVLAVIIVGLYVASTLKMYLL